MNSSSDIDHVFNFNNSLSGIFQFSKKAIALRSDFAESYISKLPMLPDWVQKLSPWNFLIRIFWWDVVKSETVIVTKKINDILW